MKKKLESNAGETLIETLCAVIVFTLSILMLSQAVVVAAKVNRNAEDASKPLQVTVAVTPSVEKGVMSVSGKDAAGNPVSTSVSVDIYTTYNEIDDETVESYMYYIPVTPES